MSVYDNLKADLGERRLILFAGSGVSATLGLPNWTGLIGHMADALGYDRELFLSFGTYPTLAEHYVRETSGLATLVAWMKTHWCHDGIDIANSRVHRRIVELNFPIIYTTNYDPWFERAHDQWSRPYTKIVTGSDISLVKESVTQIIKFHGDLDAPDSLVLTESDYFERLRFEADLDLKLRGDLLRYNVLFVGYSLTDPNMRVILHRLATSRRFARGQPKSQSYILLTRRNHIQESLFESWGVQPIHAEDLDSSTGLAEFLDLVQA